MIPRGVSFFEPKSWITQRKSNSKLFYPIGQWLKQVCIIKKTGGWKSRWTVPLKYFRFWLRIGQLFKFFNGNGKIYPGKSISLGNSTRWLNLPRVSYPCKSIKSLPNHDSPGIIPRRVNLSAASVFYKAKIQITARNINQNRKYGKPLISSPGRFK